jgi:hypothetical protein
MVAALSLARWPSRPPSPARRACTNAAHANDPPLHALRCMRDIPRAVATLVRCNAWCRNAADVELAAARSAQAETLRDNSTTTSLARQVGAAKGRAPPAVFAPPLPLSAHALTPSDTLHARRHCTGGYAGFDGVDREGARRHDSASLVFLERVGCVSRDTVACGIVPATPARRRSLSRALRLP